MPDLGTAKLTLTVAADKFRSGLDKAQTQATKTSGKISGAFGKAQQSIQSAAGRVPVFGGALSQLASPAGLAAAGIGLVVGGLGKMVNSTLNTGRRLGELREKLGVSAEAIQIYERAIEEGNGNTGAFERSTLRLQKTIGDAAGGNKKAAEQFELLGLSFEDLQNKSPEEALRAVLGAANDSLEPTDRASVLAATLGRSYADMGGFATKGADELTAMLDGVKDVAVTMSGEGVTSVDQYDTANRNMRDSFGSIVTEVGMALIPVLTQVFGVISQSMPLIKTFITIGLLPVKNAVAAVSAAINIVSALLRGDFTGALTHARNFFITVATNLLDTGAKVVGLFNKDMAEGIRGVSQDLKDMKVDAAEPAADALNNSLTPAIDGAKGATDKYADATDTAATKTVELDDAATDAAPHMSTLQQKLLDAHSDAEILRNKFALSTTEAGNLTNAAKLLSPEVQAVADAAKTASEWIADWEIKQLGARQEADLSTLAMGALRTGYSNVSLEVDPLTALVADMTEKIEAATAAEELQEAALLLLPPALRAAAAEMGLFGLSADTTAKSLDEATSAQQRFLQSQRDARNDANGNAALVNQVGGGGRTSGRYAGQSFTGLASDFTPVTSMRGHDFERTGRLLATDAGGTSRSVFRGEAGYEAALAVLDAVPPALEQATEATEDNTVAVKEDTVATEVHTEAVEKEMVAVKEDTVATETSTTATKSQTAATEVHTEAVEKELTPVEALTQRILDRTQAEQTEADAIAGLTPEIHALGVELGIIPAQVAEIIEAIEPTLTPVEMLTQRILEKADAEEVEAEAIAALSPEIHALGVELGILQGATEATAAVVADAVEELTERERIEGFQTRNERQHEEFRTRAGALRRELNTSGDMHLFNDLLDRLATEIFGSARGFQHGGSVRGSRYGSLVRVGENFTNENITPVGRGASGGPGGGSRPIRINLRLGRKEFEDVWVGTADDLVRQGRVQEDILN